MELEDLRGHAAVGVVVRARVAVDHDAAVAGGLRRMGHGKEEEQAEYHHAGYDIKREAGATGQLS
jgi:hypothetical protein